MSNHAFLRQASTAGLLVGLLALGNPIYLVAADHVGQVTLSGRPVPGATVTASQGERRFVTTTDAQGTYRLPGLPDGTWTLRVDMLGFAPASRDIVVAADAAPATWELSMLPVAEIARDSVPAPTDFPPVPAGSVPTVAAVPQTPGDTSQQQKPVSTTAPRAPAAAASASSTAVVLPALDETRPADPATGAADGFIIAGSVNNAAASPFAQSAAFGNYRPNTGRRPYTSAVTLFGTHSALNATPYSVAPTRATPDYGSLNITATLAGPLQIPGVWRGPNFQLQFQRTASDNVSSLFGRMPTSAERVGDFSDDDILVLDPATGQPFVGNTVPQGRISPEAAALLATYPLPNGDPAAPINHQAPAIGTTRGYGFTFSTGRNIARTNQVTGSTSYSRSTATSSSLFGFTNVTPSSGVAVSGTWTHRFGTFTNLRVTHSFGRQVSEVRPHFAHRINVSGLAGISGNDQDPRNWGPPALRFSGDVADLSDTAFSSTKSIANTTSADVTWTRGRHNYTFGGLVRQNRLDLVAQENARGTFFFSGRFTGSPFADFLLGLPESSAVAFGNADQRHRSWSYAAYAIDDIRVGPSLTLNLGLRWEYEAPVSEAQDRLVNLDVASGFTAVSPVLASQPIGSLTGRHYPSALVERDILGFQPRLSLAWRPVLGSSLLVRAGYDRTRSSGAAQTLAGLMAAQPPLATTGNATSTDEHPLSLAEGFVAVSDVTQNSFAVDPDFRVAYAQNWQVYVQRDAPLSMTISASYLGTHGGRLVQQFLPNTVPVGADALCPACPSGFRYVTSHGSSRRHAGRLEIRRRTRNGLTASAQYTLAKATDNSTGFGDVGGASTAQNWLDLEAERGPSSFDQRHLLGAQVTYTTGVGASGGALLTGWRGHLVRNWTIDVRTTTGSGLPRTPLFRPGTAVSPPVRADLTGESTETIAGNLYLNPAAYTAPASGTWGRAGRNSVRGPRPFTLDGSLQRSFPMGRINLDLRFDATNVLNRVVHTGLETLLGNPQFGLPTGVGSMRRINTRVSLRF